MATVTAWAAELRRLGTDAWVDYLVEHSGLPGPRANTTLAAAVAEVADARIIDELVRDGGEYPMMCAAAAVARELGIDDVVADVRPEGKLEEVRRRQAAGKRVAMVGDGVNDAAALAAADLGIAMGGGTDAAKHASDITLTAGSPRAVAEAIELSRRTLGIIRGNLFWAFAYNVAAVPLAVAGLLNPMVAAAAMAFSSVFVVLNSLRLRSALRPARRSA